MFHLRNRIWQILIKLNEIQKINNTPILLKSKSAIRFLPQKNLPAAAVNFKVDILNQFEN